jgi:hypothetical protein
MNHTNPPRPVHKSLAPPLLALPLLAILALTLPSAQATEPIAAELQIKIDQASRALAHCTVAVAEAHRTELTHDNVDRYVIGACADAHGDLVELSWGLQTPVASRILLTATIDALDAARKVLAN